MHIFKWLNKRFGTFDLLPEYFTAAGKEMQNVLWGALLPFLAWGIWFILGTPPTWVNAAAVGLALFTAGYYVWRADHLRLETKIEIAQIYTREWTVGQGPRSSGHQAKAYCIELFNRSEGITIEDTSVELSSMSPQAPNWDFLPIPLHLQNDNPAKPEDQVRSFNLNPRQHRNIDFVSALQGDNRFSIVHVVHGINHYVPFDTEGNQLQVRITAKNTPDLLAWFRVWRDNTGILQCEMIEK